MTRHRRIGHGADSSKRQSGAFYIVQWLHDAPGAVAYTSTSHMGGSSVGPCCPGRARADTTTTVPSSPHR